ncbi:MAG TPA: response regulator transcription factor, partial [Gemmatimonadaceae bacterium]|nr:response regulator transcription factor [Gemmatimonadaceae bacterium]
EEGEKRLRSRARLPGDLMLPRGGAAGVNERRTAPARSLFRQLSGVPPHHRHVNGALAAQHVLVVEGDEDLRTRLRNALAERGFEVTVVRNGATALQHADERPDAIVIDVALPDADGRDVCRSLRAVGCLSPVLFLTTPDAVADRMVGFGPGGDDYVTKPVRIDEVVARLVELMRRAEVPQPAEVGTLRLDPVTRAVRDGANEASLTPTEFRLLSALAAQPGAVITRADLVRAAWPEGAIVYDNTLDQYVARLRRKLRALASDAQITTARGVGYRFG